MPPQSAADVVPQGVDQELARTLFDAAVEKSARGEWEQAHDLLIRSRALSDRPTTALNQALVLVRLTRLREALRALEEALDLTRSPEDDELRTRIQQLRAEIAPLVGEVLARVSPAHATLTLDGVEQPASATGSYAIPVDPGAHRLEAAAPEHASSFAEIRISKGERRWIELSLAAKQTARGPVLARPSGVQVTTPAPRADAPRARTVWKSPWLWTSVGAVVVGVVVVGIVLANRDAEDQEPDGGSSGRVFTPP